MKVIFAIVTATAALLIGVQSRAEDRDDVRSDYWYIGAGLGGATVDGLCDGASSDFCDDTGLAFRGFAGWRVNRGLALEFSFEGSSGYVTPGARAAGLEGDTSTFGFSATAIGFIPLGDRVSLLGGVSGVYTEAVTDVYEEGNVPRDCDYEYDWWDEEWDYYCRYDYNEQYESGGSLAAGALLGIEVQASRRVALRMHAARYFDVDGGLAFGPRRDLDSAQVSVLVMFR